MKKNLLVATKIQKCFLDPEKVEILKGVDFTLVEGESAAIMGSSGEGKSTLLHILGTLEKATSGTLEILGEKVSNVALVRGCYLGFIFQNYNLMEDYTVLQNILMPALIQKQSIQPGSLAYLRALQLLENVGLLERKNFSTKLLSGGEKQRTAIARSLILDPPILLADEPSGNLDHANSLAIHDLLIDSCKKLGKGLIVVTHDMSLASRCNHIYTLSDGYLSKEKQ